MKSIYILLYLNIAFIHGFTITYPSQDPSTWERDCESSGGNASSFRQGGCCSSSTPTILWPNFGEESMESNSPCYPGFFCPYLDLNDSTTYPQSCAAISACQNSLLNSQYCNPQIKYQPVACAAGFYCPLENFACAVVQEDKTIYPSVSSEDECISQQGIYYSWASRSIKCPEGNYCHAGSIEPTKCWSLSNCDEGSVDMKWYGSLLLAFGTDIVVIYLTITLWRYLRKEAQIKEELAIQWDNSMKQSASQNRLSSSDSQRILGSTENTTPSIGNGIGFLVQSFQQAFVNLVPMNFTFRQLSLHIPEKVCKESGGKSILQDVSGVVSSGKVTAIMGPSGAGKTTFLNVLMDKTDKKFERGGKLEMNGKECKLSDYKSIVGYVPQEDIMMRELTVYDNVLHSARCRLPSDWSEEQIQRHVDAILKTLDLHHVASSCIGNEVKRGISGGQRKRVNVAMELAAAPISLFLDEPTSGLDSTSALVLCNALTILARETNMTISMVIHQPRAEIFDALDELLLLAPGGRTVYQGPQLHVKKYFQNVLHQAIGKGENVADAIMDGIAAHGDEYVNKWTNEGSQWMKTNFPDNTCSTNQSYINHNHNTLYGETEECTISISQDDDPSRSPRSNYLKLQNEAKTSRGASFIKQFVYCTKRSILQQYYYRFEFLLTELLITAVASIFVGQTAVSFQGILLKPYNLFSPAPQYSSMLSMGMIIGFFVGIIAASPSVKEFNEEQTVYWREASSGHNTLAYFLGKNVALLPRVFILSLNFGALYYFLSAPLVSFYAFWGIILCTWYSVYGLGIMVACVVSREAGPLLATILAIFAGLFNSAVIFPKGIVMISYMFWGSEALFQALSDKFQLLYQIENAASEVGFDLTRVTMDFFMIVLIGTIFRVLAYAGLIGLNKEKQS